MQRIILTLSDDEYATLRQLAYERHQPLAKLIRAAIDHVYGTTDDVPPPGRPSDREVEKS